MPARLRRRSCSAWRAWTARVLADGMPRLMLSRLRDAALVFVLALALPLAGVVSAWLTRLSMYSLVCVAKLAEKKIEPLERG